MKILEELWYGNINPNERDVRTGSRLHKLGTLILRDCQSELHGINECEAFCIGFRLGARITYEAMEGNDIPSIDD